MTPCDTINTARTDEVCEGYIFTPVCQSFCSQGGLCVRGGGCPGGLCPVWGFSVGGVSVRETPPYGNEQAVRILLECILVPTNGMMSTNSFFNGAERIPVECIPSDVVFGRSGVYIPACTGQGGVCLGDVGLQVCQWGTLHYAQICGQNARTPDSNSVTDDTNRERN